MKQSKKAHKTCISLSLKKIKKAAQIRYKQVEKIGITLSKAKSDRSIVTQAIAI
jgi:hypothetical protein